MVHVTRQGGALLVGLLFSFLAAGAPAASAQTSSTKRVGPCRHRRTSRRRRRDQRNGSFTVTGAGLDVGGTSDEFHYAYQRITGDLDIRVRVATLQNVDPAPRPA